MQLRTDRLGYIPQLINLLGLSLPLKLKIASQEDIVELSYVELGKDQECGFKAADNCQLFEEGKRWAKVLVSNMFFEDAIIMSGVVLDEI